MPNRDHEFFLGTTENSGSIEDAPAAPRNVKAATQPPDSFFQLMPDEAGKRIIPKKKKKQTNNQKESHRKSLEFLVVYKNRMRTVSNRCHRRTRIKSR